MEEEQRYTARKLHSQYNSASSRVNMLERMILIREAGNGDSSNLSRLLVDAQAEKNALHKQLAEAGLLKILSQR